MSRLVGIGVPAAFVLAGIALAVAGLDVVGFAVAATGLVGLTSWAFYEIGLTEDRDLALEERRRRRRREREDRVRRRRLRLPPRR